MEGKNISEECVKLCKCSSNQIGTCHKCEVRPFDKDLLQKYRYVVTTGIFFKLFFFDVCRASHMLISRYACTVMFTKGHVATCI